MKRAQRITIRTKVRHGKACIDGTCVTVDEILECLTAGMTEQEILAEFSTITAEDVLACVAHRAEEKRKREGKRRRSPAA